MGLEVPDHVREGTRGLLSQTLQVFEVLATNTMTDQVFIATPAIAGGEIFLRSKTTLFCIKQGS